MFLYYIMLYDILLYHTIPHHTIRFHTILYSTLLYYIILYHNIIYSTITIVHHMWSLGAPRLPPCEEATRAPRPMRTAVRFSEDGLCPWASIDKAPKDQV